MSPSSPSSLIAPPILPNEVRETGVGWPLLMLPLLSKTHQRLLDFLSKSHWRGGLEVERSPLEKKSIHQVSQIAP